MLFEDTEKVDLGIHPVKKEHSVEHKIEEKIRKLNGYVIKNQAGSETGRGKPDLSACIKGKYYGIEVKRYDASHRIQTTLNQIVNLIKIARAGGEAFYSKTPNMFNLKNGRTIKMTKPYVKQIEKYLRESDVIAIKIKADSSMVIFRKTLKDK